ncbi:CpaF family protein [Glycomyces sp. MUSA5-2]|uniref:CpaF family protein n=1 Tax=Glycomyces sp. MUSA5-2 TaxID=2053002 RepID=UPI00300A9A1C
MTTTAPALSVDAADETATVEALCAAAREVLAARPAPGPGERPAAIANAAEQVVQQHSQDLLRAGRSPVDAAGQRRLRQAVEARLSGLGAFAPLLADESIEDIWCIGCDNITVVRAGDVREAAAPVATSDADLVDLVRAIVAAGGTDGERRFDAASPTVNYQLPDGSRLHATLGVSDRPTVSIRRHRLVEVSLAELRAARMFGADIAAFLEAAVAARCNMIISGPFRSGKTTLLGALAGLLPAQERLITIEDARELGLHRDSRHSQVVSFETREPNIEGAGEVSASRLFREALRMSPDRIIVGEVRGGEVRVMLEAMSTGTDGSLCTMHTSSSQGVFSKIKSFARDGGLDPEAAAEKIAEGLDFIVQIRHTPSRGRYISSIREVRGAEGTQVASNELWEEGRDGRVLFRTMPSQARAERLLEHGWVRPELAGW